MPKKEHRQLAAILFADIMGYTALMQQDEVLAKSQLGKFREELTQQAALFNGRIVHFYGDGCLCFFNDPSDATRCARSIQLVFQQEPVVPVRIGLHSGTVVLEGDHVFGNAINVCSRIESMGIPGSVLLSERIEKDLRNQPDIQTKAIGQFAFKNVQDPVSVYALASEGLVIPKREEMKGKARPVARRNEFMSKGALLVIAILALAVAGYLFFRDTEIEDKSIAVLPFENFDKDPEQQYFSDGISQDILAHLSGIRDLQVIAFNSSRQFRDQEQNYQEIGTALGARHLLNGSIHQSGDQLRIRAQLVDAKTGRQLWAGRYDEPLKDIFEIQSAVSREIAEVLKAELLPPVVARINQAPTANLEAYQEYSQGRYLWEQRGNDNLLKAETHYKKAIELDSSFAEAYAGLAQIYVILGITDPEYATKGKAVAEKSIALDPMISDGYAALGHYYIWETDFAKGIINLEKALAIDPGNATAYQWYGDLLVGKGEIKRGIEMNEIARRLDPGSKIIQLMGLLHKLASDEYTQATAELEAFYRHSPEVGPVGYYLLYCYVMLGEYDKIKEVNIVKDRRQYKMDLIHFRETRQLDKVSALKEKASTLSTLSEGFIYEIEATLLLLNGQTDAYIDRLDSLYFQFSNLDELQYFPPPDSIRLHPKFQEMMKRRDFTVRPRSEALKNRMAGGE